MKDTSDSRAFFEKHKSIWRRATAHLSNLRVASEHPSARAIVGMGMKAVPFIVRDMRKWNHWWFDQLDEIIGESPEYPIEIRGRLRELTRFWLRWAEEKGYIEAE